MRPAGCTASTPAARWRNLFASTSWRANTASLIPEMSLVSPSLIASPPHQIQMSAKRELLCLPATDPGQSSASWQPERNQTLFSRATIRFVALQTWCWAMRQPRLHPAMSSLRNYPHYTHSSQSAGYAGNQNPISKLRLQRRHTLTKTSARVARIVSPTFPSSAVLVCSTALCVFGSD